MTQIDHTSVEPKTELLKRGEVIAWLKVYGISEYQFRKVESAECLPFWRPPGRTNAAKRYYRLSIYQSFILPIINTINHERS